MPQKGGKRTGNSDAAAATARDMPAVNMLARADTAATTAASTWPTSAGGTTAAKGGTGLLSAVYRAAHNACGTTYSSQGGPHETPAAHKERVAALPQPLLLLPLLLLPLLLGRTHPCQTHTECAAEAPTAANAAAAASTNGMDDRNVHEAAGVDVAGSECRTAAWMEALAGSTAGTDKLYHSTAAAAMPEASSHTPLGSHASNI